MKTCKDFDYTGVKCCSVCHDYDELEIVKIDGAQPKFAVPLRHSFTPKKMINCQKNKNFFKRFSVISMKNVSETFTTTNGPFCR